jgi:capsular polysaccharide biosynthesis protein
VTAGTSTPVAQPLLDLQRIVVTIRRRRRSWLSVALLGLLAGGLLTVLMPAPPTAVTRLLVIHEHDESMAGGTLIMTDIALMETTRIADQTLKRLNSTESPETFLKTYKATELTNNVLEIKVSAPSKDEAVARAQALADTFIADHVQRTKAAADANAAALLDQRDLAQSELAKVEGSIAAMPEQERRKNPAAINTLYSRRADLTSQITQLGNRAQEAAVGAPWVAAGTQIVDAPRVVSNSLLKRGVLSALIGLIVGLTMGLSLAAISSVVRDRPTLRRDIAANLGASVIAQLPVPRRGPARLWRRSRRTEERRRVAATLVRAVRGDAGAVSLLELGTPQITAALALDMAEELAAGGPVVVVDDLPRRNLAKNANERDGPIRIVDGAQNAAGSAGQRERRIGVGSVAPGTAWTDLRRLGPETVLVVRAGQASTSWLHTVARQLADLQIPVIGVVLVDPDPRDRSDGTLWDGLHTALRGRARPSRGATPRPDALAPAPARAAGRDGVANAGAPSRDDNPTERFGPIWPTSEDVEVS